MSEQHEPAITEFLGGATAIAEFLGSGWTARKVYHARESGALPIRRRRGLGIYAFKSELTTALRDPATLTHKA